MYLKLLIYLTDAAEHTRRHLPFVLVVGTRLRNARNGTWDGSLGMRQLKVRKKENLVIAAMMGRCTKLNFA